MALFHICPDGVKAALEEDLHTLQEEPFWTPYVTDFSTKFQWAEGNEEKALDAFIVRRLGYNCLVCAV